MKKRVVLYYQIASEAFILVMALCIGALQLASLALGAGLALFIVYKILA